MSLFKAFRSLIGRRGSGKNDATKKRLHHFPRQFEMLEDRRLLSTTIDITAGWLTQHGVGPFILTSSDLTGTTYRLQTDVSVAGTAFVFGGKNITLDLNGHTVTYGNGTPIVVANGGFETGTGRTVAGWNLNSAPDASIAANSYYMWGNQVLQFTDIATKETILSDAIAIPVANHEYTASVTAKGPYGAAVTLYVIDAVTQAVLASGNAADVSRAFSAKVPFVPTTTNNVYLKIEVSPGSLTTATVALDYAVVAPSRDYGILATGAAYFYPDAYLPEHLHTTAVVNAIASVGTSTASNLVIKNGNIVQGTGKGFSSYTVNFDQTIGVTLDGVHVSINGPDTGAVQGGYTQQPTVQNCSFISAVDLVTHRMFMDKAMINFGLSTGPVVIQNNTFTDAAHIGIYVSGASNVTIHGNTINSNTIVTDGYGILTNSVHDFEISDNTIIAGLGKSGRGILIDCQTGMSSSNGEIFGNYVDIRERAIPEYGTGGIEATALRMRAPDRGIQNIHIHDNSFIARTGDAGYAHAAFGGALSFWYSVPPSEYLDWGILVENNLFKGIVSTNDTNLYANGLTLEAVDVHSSPLVKNNVLESNDISLALSGRDDGLGALDGKLISNTFRKNVTDAPSVSRDYKSIYAGYWINPIHSIYNFNPTYENGATSTISWVGSGTKDISMGWLLGVQVQNAGGTALTGATVRVLDKDGLQIFSGTSNANGYLTSQSDTVSAEARGSLSLTAQPSDGNTMTIGDGVHAATIFEFDNNASVSPGHVATAIGGTKEATMANLVAAVNAASNLDVTANSFGAAYSCTLHNDTAGLAGNVAITKACANLTVSGMDGGGAFVPVVTTVYRQISSNPAAITTDARGPFRVEVSLAGYTTSNQQITLNQSQNLLVQLASSGGNTPPVAANDAYSVNEDAVLSIAASGVLTNDTDVDGNPLTAVLVAGPTHGTLVLNANGSFTYTPAANYNGTDSFTYRASDGTVQSNTATVNLTINAVNDAPAAANDAYSVNEDVVLSIAASGVLANDSDVDGNPLTAVLVAGPTHGTLVLNTNGSFTYTPAANYYGADSFTYKASDGTVQSNTATVNLTINAVNDPPVAANDAYSVNEDAVLTVATPGVLANDTDVEGNSLTAAVVAGPTHGTLVLNANGSFTYTPAANYNGSDSFTYKAGDGTAQSNTATVNLTVNAVNDAPVAANNAYSVNENAVLSIAASGVLANDSDVDGNPLTAVLVAGPAHGTLVLNANGSFTYTPTANYDGTDSFTYKASDGTVQSNTATVNLTINAVNDPPVAGNDAYSVNEDAVLTVATPGVLANDTDAQASSLTAVLVAGPTHGTLVLNANGSFTYTPAANYNGTDSFTYRASDGTVQSNTATVNLTINAVNDAPAAANDAYSVNEDVVLSIAASGVLANDSDVDGNPLTAVLVAGPTHGTLVLNTNGSFTYTPAANYYGADSFTYKASDGTVQSNTATVNLTINAVNDPPVAANDAYSVNEDAVLTVATPGVLANDTDVEGNSLTAAVVAGPTHGTLVLNANGSFTYTPAANYNGSDSFTYKAGDGTAQSNTATVNLTVNAVNDAPVAANNAYSVNEDAVLTVATPGVLANDTDVEGNSLTAAVVAGPTHGTLVLNTNGSFTYTPTANYNGTDSFTYKASDGTAQSNTATVNLTVNAVNDAPVAGNDAYGVNEDAVLSIATSGVLANDTDVDGGTLTAAVIAGPTHGTLVLNANGSFTYTPAANYYGTDSFTYKAGDGTAQSNTATVNLTINAVNDEPVAANDAYNVNEDAVLTVATPGVLANDTDVDGNPLTAAVVTGPTHGTLVLNANGSFIYTPAANYNGTDSFTYKASDGTAQSNTATVNLTVNGVNNPPVAANDAYIVNEDAVLTVATPGVLANDTDADGNTLTAVLVAGPTHGTLVLNANGSFTYTPAANYNGSDSFTYKAGDGTAQSNTATVNLTINAVNDSPTAVYDAYSVNEDAVLTVATPGVLSNDTDADGNTLTAVLAAGPTHGTLVLNANGSFTYTPAANYNGSDSFIYRTSDGTAQSNIATVNLTINAVNDPPVAINDAYSVNEDAVLSIAANGVLANDSDVDGNPLTAVLVTGPTHGTLVLNANGSLTYTPAANYNGADSFTYKASDGTAQSNTATVNLTVNAVNDAPVAANDAYSVNEDAVLTVATPGVLANDTDVEGSALTAAVVAGPTHGTLVLNANGSFTYTPAANYNGTDSFSYKANDGTAQSNTATVNLTINAVNDAPAAANDAYSVNEDAVLSIAASGVLANDSDVDGNPLTAVLLAGPTHGTLVLNANGSFTYTPAANYNGTDSFSYKANDGTVQSNTATVNLTINAVNDPPAAANDAYSVNEDTALAVAAPGVLANDTDVEGSALTAAVVAGPTHGTLVLNANGSFTYMPAANYSGTDSFTYKAGDGTAQSNTATVNLTVNAVNDPPVAANDAYSVNEDAVLTLATPGALANDTDVDGNPLTAAMMSGPAHGTLAFNSNGSFTYTPDVNYYGSDSFTYRALDGVTQSSAATVNLTINAVNDPPVAVNNAYIVNQDTVLSVASGGVLSNDTDVEGSALTAVVVSGPAHGTLALNANGSFIYTPFARFRGADSFTYRASDGTAQSNTATVSITVKKVNHPPRVIDHSYNISAGTPLSMTTNGVLAGSVDEDEDPLTAVLVDGPTHGTLNLNADGSFSYMPAANYSGTDSFTYKANDGEDDSNVATVSMTINAVNPAFLIPDSSVVVVEEQYSNGIVESNERIVISWATSSDNPVATRSLTVDGNAVNTIYGPYTTPNNKTRYWSGVLGPLAAGTHTINIQAADAIGNSAVYNGTFEVQSGAIAIPAGSVVVAELSPANGTLESSEQLVLTWATTGNYPVASKSLTIDGNTVNTIYGPYAGQSGANNWAGVVGPLSVGVHNYTVQVTDGNGNTASRSGTFEVLQGWIAISNVVIAEASPANGSLESNEQLVITWATTCDTPLASKSLTVDGNAVNTLYGPYATQTANTYDWAGVFGPVTSGTHNFTIHVTDGNSHSADYSGAFEVLAAAPRVALNVDSSVSPEASPDLLAQQQLDVIVAEAKSRLAAALGTQISTALAGMSIEIGDLPGTMLGEAHSNKIIIDRDAAGYGWFVDSTPKDDAEFAEILGPYALASRKGTAADLHVDLLTTVMHEMGHVLGYGHSNSLDLMYSTLPLGERLLFDDQGT